MYYSPIKRELFTLLFDLKVLPAAETKTENEVSSYVPFALKFCSFTLFIANIFITLFLQICLLSKTY